MTKHGIHNIGTGRPKQDYDFAYVRLKQIELLKEWTNKNTDFHEISAYDAVKFFYSDKESDTEEFEPVLKIYNAMIEWSMDKFNIGKYTARDYANTILLTKTKGHDIEKIRNEVINNSSIIKPNLSDNAKISIIQKTLLDLLEKSSNEAISEKFLSEKLIKEFMFTENEVTEFIRKAVKLRAIIEKNPHQYSL